MDPYPYLTGCPFGDSATLCRNWLIFRCRSTNAGLTPRSPHRVNLERRAPTRNPQTTNHQPQPTNRQQATINRQPATGNRQQATGNRQPATGNRQQAAAPRSAGKARSATHRSLRRSAPLRPHMTASGKRPVSRRPSAPRGREYRKLDPRTMLALSTRSASRSPSPRAPEATTPPARPPSNHAAPAHLPHATQQRGTFEDDDTRDRARWSRQGVRNVSSPRRHGSLRRPG